MEIWTALGSLGTLAAAAVAAWAAFQSRASADQANTAATKLTAIESQRSHNELCPRFRVTLKPSNPGSDILDLRVMLVGPPSLDRLDRLTVAVRNDHFLRGEGTYQHMGGPTDEQVRAHIWGPYRFRPSTGPGGARADITGRETVYDSELPIGEELPFVLEHTGPPTWSSPMTTEAWLRDQGTVVRIAFTAEHDEHGRWYVPCELDVATMPVTLTVPAA